MTRLAMKKQKWYLTPWLRISGGEWRRHAFIPGAGGPEWIGHTFVKIEGLFFPMFIVRFLPMQAGKAFHHMRDAKSWATRELKRIAAKRASKERK